MSKIEKNILQDPVASTATYNSLLELVGNTPLTKVNWPNGTVDCWELTFKPDYEVQTFTLESLNAATAFIIAFKMGYNRFRPAATI